MSVQSINKLRGELEKEENIQRFIDNPVIPSWMNDHLVDEGEPHTVTYDADSDIITLHLNTGQVFYYEDIETLHDENSETNSNTVLVGEIPDVDVFHGFVSVASKDKKYGNTSRMLFFRSEKSSYELALYQVYLCLVKEMISSEVFKNNDYHQVKNWMMKHMVFWHKGREYNERKNVFDDNTYVRNCAIIDGDNHVWQSSVTAYPKDENGILPPVKHVTTGDTIEQSLINLSTEIYNTYDWTGAKR